MFVTSFKKATTRDEFGNCLIIWHFSPLLKSHHAVQSLQIANGEHLRPDVCWEDEVTGMSFADVNTLCGAAVNIHIGDWAYILMYNEYSIVLVYEPAVTSLCPSETQWLVWVLP